MKRNFKLLKLRFCSELGGKIDLKCLLLMRSMLVLTATYQPNITAE